MNSTGSTTIRSDPKSIDSDFAPNVECVRCAAENPTSRKFCSGCGAALWEICIECGANCRPNDHHCGACGASLAAAVQKRIDELRPGLNRAEELIEDERPGDAIELVQQTLNSEHPRLAGLRERGKEIVARAREEIARLERLPEIALAEAQELSAQGDYERAAVALEQVPPHLTTQPINELLSQVRDLQIEVLTLTSEIQQALRESQLDGLLTKVDRLTKLKPDNTQAKGLQSQLRALEAKKNQSRCQQLSKLAAAEIERHNYEAALKRLEQIPESDRTTEIVKLLEKVAARAAEVRWLTSDLRDAVIYDELLLPLAQRLLKLQPENSLAKKSIAVLQPHAKLATADRLRAKLDWPRPPDKSRMGVPVDIFRGFTRLVVDPSQTAVLNDPGSYCVATGLALQGLERATLSISLAPREKGGILSLLKAKKRSFTTAWGIDLGASALKAVRLSLDPKTGNLAIIASAYVPIQPSPDQVSRGGDCGPTRATYKSLERALGSLLDQIKLEGAAVCVSFPAERTFTRLFDLPPIDPKKITDVMQYEVKQQIPLPVESLAWDYQVFSTRDEPTRKTPSEQPIVLVGAKADDVEAHLKPLADRGIKVDVVASDCTALANLLAFERFTSEPKDPASSTGSKGVIAMLEVGTNSSNIAATDGRTVLLRSIPVAGGDFTRALVKQFGLARQQAESLKRSPVTAPLLHQVYGALEPQLQRLAVESQKSLEQYLAQEPRRQARELVVTGAGAKLHGLVKFFCSGPWNAAASAVVD
jgi:type IV pilus assembly protein PilM